VKLLGVWLLPEGYEKPRLGGGQTEQKHWSVIHIQVYESMNWKTEPVGILVMIFLRVELPIKT
jgi:hypothetical protein